MAKRRKGASDEMLLIPFLDLMCSLIGVLVLVIVFLCVSQANQTEGRSREEIDRATEYQRLKKQLSQDKVMQEKVIPLLEKLKELEKELDKKQKAANLRKLQQQATQAKRQESENKKKELDNLLLEIEGFEKQIKDLKKEIEELLAQIKELKLKNNTPPPVLVRPSGSGMASDTKNFFVEASGGKIVLYWDEQRKTQVSSQPEVIIADTSFDAFLKKVKAEPKAKLIFLVREDGYYSFNNAAGWAQQTHGFEPSQLGRLPIPGRGAIQLNEFKQFIGSMTPPPDAPLLPPFGPATPPPAPPKAPATTPSTPPKPTTTTPPTTTPPKPAAKP